MREAFIYPNLKKATLATISRANSIIDEYQAQGFTLTLRQLYYQFVARGLLANKQSEYKRLGSIIDTGRKAGLIDWSAIEDRTRHLRKLGTWDDPEQILNAVARQYREDWWRDQPNYIEVWIEKDALIGVIEGVCDEFQLPYFACRGYASQSELYEAGKRLARRARDGQDPVILHLGDHDPSGIDMTRDIEERLLMFSASDVKVERLALNMPQVEQYDPPPNPAKMTDSRFGGYEAQYGRSSWELDALEPQVISDLIRDTVLEYIDTEAWNHAQVNEETAKEDLTMLAARYGDAVESLREQP